MPSKPMTAAEVAALERVLVRVHKALPTIDVAVAMAGKKMPPFAAAVAKAREVAAFGLSADDARKIVKATDTESEREVVRKWSSVLASKADADILTKAVLRMAREALAEPGATPPPRPVVAVPWRDRLKRQMCFMAAPSYLWHRQTEINRILDAIQAAGLDGPSFDFAGEWMMAQYKDRGPDIPAPRNNALEIYRELFDAWVPWDAGLRARGLVAHIAFLNSNGHLANKRTNVEWEALAGEFAFRFGADNKIVLPLSETDARTRPQIGEAIYRGLRTKYPAEQLIGYGKAKWGRYIETHKGRTKVPTGPASLLVVNDNGPAIADLYGSDWVRGGTSNPARIEEYARECRRKGVSCAVYSFGRVFDYPGCAAAGRGWGKVAVQPEQPAADARDAIPASSIQIVGKHRLNPAKARITSVMHSAKIARGLVTVKHDPLTGWPVGQKESGCNSGFVIVWQEGGGFVGGWFDHGRAPSQSVKTLKNVTNGYVDKRKPASGARVWFYKISTDGKYRTTICAGGKWP